jgi:hypothetical protein
MLLAKQFGSVIVVVFAVAGVVFRKRRERGGEKDNE